MSEQYTPTTEEVREVWEYHLSEGMASEAVKYDANWDTDRLLAQFDRWLAKRDAEVAAKAWDEGRAAEKLAWEHAFDGHPVPEGEMCGECVVENPYRKAVES